jgi:hypothetical protein
MSVPSEVLLRAVRATRERARRTRAEARCGAEVAWRRRYHALALLMRTRELSRLRLTLPPDSSELRRLRKLARRYASSHGADTEAVALAAHQAVARVLIGGNPTTKPIDVELSQRGGTLELRVQARIPAGAKRWPPADDPMVLQLIAGLADGFETRSTSGGTFEIYARFATDRRCLRRTGGPTRGDSRPSVRRG